MILSWKAYLFGINAHAWITPSRSYWSAYDEKRVYFMIGYDLKRNRPAERRHRLIIEILGRGYNARPRSV